MKRETHPNIHMVTYHVKKRVTDSMIEMYNSKNWRGVDAADSSLGGLLGFFRKLFLGKASEMFLEKENHNRLSIGELIDDIFAVDGIVSICVSQYEIRVEKGEVFDWQEVEPGVITAMRKHGYEEEQKNEPKCG